MSNLFHFYISAAADLVHEREILGRAVADIPVDLGWRIGQSPLASQPPDLGMVAQADLHLLLLSSDIRAPIGQEWFVARQTGRQPIPFLKQDVARTPAALDFIRFVKLQARWRPFKDGASLRRIVLSLLVEGILDQAARFALTAVEVERLQAFRRELEDEPAMVEETIRGGAGESSVILSQERYVPSEGVLLQPDEDAERDNSR